ncbi:MAG: HD domain-containing protein [Chitinophagaceae bacterium]|nr:HD domain-containing protein [Chitinophagaceae bacterium]
MTGDFNWGLKTQGNLNSIAKINFACQAIRARRCSKNTNRFIYTESDFKIPDSTLIHQTIEFLKDTHQDFLINHCYRTYVFGHVIGRNENLPFDQELFAIASLLHDVGLTKNHQFKHANCKCFAVEGAVEAGIFLETKNVEEDKIKQIQDAIALHLNIKVSVNLPEAYMLNKAAAVDVIGRDLQRFEPAFIEKTITAYSRLHFKSAIHQLMKEQSKARPKSRISFLYQNGFASLIKKSGFEE